MKHPVRASAAMVAAAAMLLMMVLVPATSAHTRYLIQFQSPTFSVIEGEIGSVKVWLYRNGTGTGSVLVSTTRGTATAGTDYTALTQELVTFDTTSTLAYVEVPILIDKIPGEVDETVKLKLSSPSRGWGLTSPRTATLTIHEMPVPSASMGIATTNTPEGKILVSWSAVSFSYGTISYVVWRLHEDMETPPSVCLTGGVWENLTPTPISGTTEFLDTTGMPGHLFGYCVATQNEDNSSATDPTVLRGPTSGYFPG